MSYSARRLRRAQREAASGGSGVSVGWLITGIGLGVLASAAVAGNLEDIQRDIKICSM